MWKLVATYAPILGATLIAGALTIDEYHNWYDCLAGAIIGTVMAFSAFRMVYASIWDWRINHIPLNRAVPFAGKSELEDAVFTRQAGWGMMNEGGYGSNEGVTGDAGMLQGGNVNNRFRHSHGMTRKPVGGHNQGVVGSDNMV